MFATTTVQGLQVPVYNIQQIQQNFNFSAGTPDMELNNATPHVAMAAAQIITQSIANQHPLRVNAMNMFGQNAFANQEFRSFITHVMRISYAMFLQKQINSIQQIVSAKLPEFIQLASAALATRNPAVMQCLDQNTLMNAQQMAQQWFQLAQNAENIIAQAQQQMQMGGGFHNNAMMQQPMMGGFGVQPQNPLNNFGTSFGGKTGAFTEVGATNFNAPTHDASAATTGRYQRKLQEELSQPVATQQPPQQGITYIGGNNNTPVNFAAESTTSVMLETPVAEPVKIAHKPGTTFQDRLRAEMEAALQQTAAPLQSTAQSIIERQAAAVATQETSPAMVSFQQQVQSLGQEPVYLDPPHKSTIHDSSTMTASFNNAPVAVEEVVVKIEPPVILKEFMLNGHNFRMVSVLHDTSYIEAGWAPSKFQTHFPAWCRRTHEIIYAINDEGVVIANAIPIGVDKVSEMFNYEAHAIDPTKGLPVTKIEIPVREEAKILYDNRLEPEVEIQVRADELNATSSDDLIQQVVVDAAVAFEKKEKLQYHASSGLVLTAITTGSEQATTEAYEQVRNVYLSVSFDAAAKAIAEIKQPALRRRIEEMFRIALNDVLALQLGLDAKIDSFIDEAGTIIEDVAKEHGNDYATVLTEIQSKVIASVCDAQMPAEAISHHASLLEVEDGEDADNVSAKMFYISHKESVAVSRFTEDELAIGLAPYAACMLRQDCYPALYACIRKMFESKYITTQTVTFLTVDGKAYKVSQSSLNPASFLIMGA